MPVVRLLHIHAIGPNIVTPLARLLGLRVISTHHGEDYQREKWGRIGRFVLPSGEREAVCRAHACISISPTVAESLRARYGRPITFIPNGVTSIPQMPAGEMVARLGLEPGRYVLNVARLVPEKRQTDLIDAFLAAGLAGVKLVLVGGADHESDYVRAVRARAMGRADILLAGHVSGPPLAELFWNAGLFALPSSHEGLPIVLLEAMSCGLPVVVSNLPVHSAMGLPDSSIAPLGDVGALAKKLQNVFTKPQPRPDWTEILAHYRWSEIARKTAELYEQVLGQQMA